VYSGEPLPPPKIAWPSASTSTDVAWLTGFAALQRAKRGRRYFPFFKEFQHLDRYITLSYIDETSPSKVAWPSARLRTLQVSLVLLLFRRVKHRAKRGSGSATITSPKLPTYNIRHQHIFDLTGSTFERGRAAASLLTLVVSPCRASITTILIDPSSYSFSILPPILTSYSSSHS
jgi:hypothetical protein